MVETENEDGVIKIPLEIEVSHTNPSNDELSSKVKQGIEHKHPCIATPTTPILQDNNDQSFIYSTSPNSIIKIAVDDDEQNREIDRKSKYKDILEMSRNLDEKYNTLILNKPKLRPTDLSLPHSNNTTRTSPSPKFDLTPSPIKLLDTQHFKKSPSKETSDDLSAQRSPSHIYNPFPVRLSTRQKKDVAVKLGLYKK